MIILTPQWMRSQRFFNYVERRFWSFTNKTEECWLWTGPVNADGYGTIRLALRTICLAHRFSWVLHGNDLRIKDQVLHKCDMPSCVRPDHLFVGNNDMNILDMFQKGRSWHGQHQNRSKLSEAEVICIRREYTPVRGVATALAKRYGISVTSVIGIVRRRRWKYLP